MPVRLKSVRAASLVAAALLAFFRIAEPLALTPGGPAVNYVEVSPTIATSGMPTRAQLAALAAERKAIVNLAPSNAMGSHGDEKEIVEKAGARYVHVPVDFSRPTHEDYEVFARAMRELQGQPVLVHCQVNMRASSFVFLYRASELKEDPERAFEAVQKIWQPNAVWARFIRDELKARGIAVPLALG